MQSLIQTYLYQPLSPTTQTLPKRTAGEGQVGQKHPPNQVYVGNPP